MLSAIDRDYLQRSVFFDLGSLAISAIDTRLGWPYNPAVDYGRMYPFDAKRAIALLDEAGVKPDANGTRFNLPPVVRQRAARIWQHGAGAEAIFGKPSGSKSSWTGPSARSC
ncbi:MAG: hypothetical protein WDO24_22930 [Pseudomonadota bacterium]